MTLGQTLGLPLHSLMGIGGGGLGEFFVRVRACGP